MTPLELAAVIIADPRRVQVYPVTHEPASVIQKLRVFLNRLGYRTDRVRLAVVPGTMEICAMRKAEHDPH